MYYTRDKFFKTIDDALNYFKKIYFYTYIELVKNNESNYTLNIYDKNYNPYIDVQNKNRFLSWIEIIRYVEIDDINRLYIIRDSLGEFILVASNASNGNLIKYIDTMDNKNEHNFYNSYIKILELIYNNSDKQYIISAVYQYYPHSSDTVTKIMSSKKYTYIK